MRLGFKVDGLGLFSNSSGRWPLVLDQALRERRLPAWMQPKSLIPAPFNPQTHLGLKPHHEP